MQVTHFKRYSTTYPGYLPNYNCNKDLSFGDNRIITAKDYKKSNVMPSNFLPSKQSTNPLKEATTFKTDDGGALKTRKVLAQYGINPDNVRSSNGFVFVKGYIIDWFIDKVVEINFRKLAPIITVIALIPPLIFLYNWVSEGKKAIDTIKKEETYDQKDARNIEGNMLGKNVPVAIEEGVMNEQFGTTTLVKTKAFKQHQSTTAITNQTSAATQSSATQTEYSAAKKANDLISAMFASDFKLDQEVLILSFPKDFRVITEPLKNAYAAADDNIVSTILKFSDGTYAIMIENFKIASIFNGKKMKTSAPSGLTYCKDLNKITNIPDEIRTRLMQMARPADPFEETLYHDIYKLNCCICTDMNSPTNKGASLRIGDRLLQVVRNINDEKNFVNDVKSIIGKK